MKITNHFKSKLYTYFVKRLGAYPYRHGWLKVPICPYCGREKKMGINLSLFRCNCFRCNAHPSPTQLIMDVEHLDTYSELLKFLDQGDFNELTFKEEKYELQESKPVYLPEGFVNISSGKSQLSKSIRSYVRNRGLKIPDLSRMGVGYVTSGPLFGYLIIPFTYHGKLIYYNARRVIGNGPRYNNPTKDITGLGKEFIIFNKDALEMYRTIYICEGAINAMTMGPQGIATMGKAISQYQFNEMVKSPAERFIILLDPDATHYAINLGLKLVNFKKVKVIILPEGKDCNDLGKSKVMRLVYETRYQTYQDLIQLRNSLS